MNTLVLCPCRHPVEGHDLHGCNGNRGMRCQCRLAPSEALDAAIESVRSTYARAGVDALQPRRRE